jgi:D-serine deaminase-like pyridoxal phosphate-dependent protein
VPEVGLDLDLASQLVLDVRLLQLLFEQNLEGDDVLAVLLASQVHVAELAAAQRLTDVEVAYLFIVGSGGRRCGASG